MPAGASKRQGTGRPTARALPGLYCCCQQSTLEQTKVLARFKQKVNPCLLCVESAMASPVLEHNCPSQPPCHICQVLALLILFPPLRSSAALSSELTKRPRRKFITAWRHVTAIPLVLHLHAARLHCTTHVPILLLLLVSSKNKLQHKKLVSVISHSTNRTCKLAALVPGGWATQPCKLTQQALPPGVLNACSSQRQSR